MKNILVLTDYSTCARGAMRYAVEMAATLKGQLIFCHVTAAPTAQDENILRDYVAAFQQQEAPALQLLPHICIVEAGSPLALAQSLAQSHHIQLIVMGLSGSSPMRRQLIGSNSDQMMAQAPAPLLLIPENARFVPLHKIGFATDLSEGDLQPIQEVARLFAAFNPELLLTHISPEASDFHDPRSAAHLFLNRITCNVNYAKIYYRHITEADISAGLLWISEHGRIDIMAMIHRQNRVLPTLLHQSYTQKMADLIYLPLLVMPE